MPIFRLFLHYFFTKDYLIFVDNQKIHQTNLSFFEKSDQYEFIKINTFFRGNDLQLVRNLKKKKENLTWVELKSHLLAIYKPDNVQRTLRSELKAIKLDVNYEENVLKFKQIINKIEKIDEFEFVWMFFDAVDPRLRAELESKNVKTLDDPLNL
ncbi:hypothetical protein BpHYR1_054330 [Brachionus plicatilis]|uniref:Retrotransposon gag domain-containing protein n=1 Tax=Brachionus plicatilis TaxID=10195 RepID=A0A3M7S3Z1_BRAPC|nr:hypothetical protein BpHYR1_054330 [Brachionus plicatilis]